ncbi:hypothetical protein FRB99_003523 [Tulasnella sp. 403]|nr:hypothetical protein FRB99_003523 [Tulasnella sp. 403]
MTAIVDSSPTAISISHQETQINEDSGDTSNHRSVNPDRVMDEVYGNRNGRVPQPADQLGQMNLENIGGSAVQGRPATNRNQEVAESAERVRQLEDALRLMEQQKSKAETKVTELERRYSSLEQGRTQAEERARQAADDIKAKDKELTTLREFLCLHNFISEAELKEAVTLINDIIEDVAQRVADQLCNPDRPIVSSSNTSKKPPHQKYKPEELVGSHFLSILEKCPPRCDDQQIYLQWALQATVVHVVSDYLRLFFFPGLEKRSADGDYRELSEVIQKGETQPSHGNWRAMTHKYLRIRLTEADREHRTAKRVDTLLTSCYSVSKSLLKDSCPSFDLFKQLLDGDTKSIVKEVAKLSKMIQEDMHTAQYTPFVSEAGSKFDNTQMVLEGDGDENGITLCTVRFGMSYTSKSSREVTAVMKTGVLQKATVITLESVGGHDLQVKRDDLV